MVLQFLSRLSVRPAVALTAAGLLAVWLATGSALGGFSANVSNSSNTVASGTVAASVSDSAGCSSTSAAPGATVNCPGLLVPATVPTSGSASRSATISRAGLLDAGSASLQSLGCGPSELLDGGSQPGPALPRWGTTFGVTGPLSGSAALRLDGTSGYAESTSAENGSAAGLQAFTIGVWFKSAVTAASSGSGSLLAFEDAPTGAGAAASDRILSMDAQGHLVFSAQASPRVSVSTTRTYLDSTWHLAVATAAASTGTLTVSVDGRQVSFTSNKFKAAGTSNPGYWKIGLSATGTGVGVPGYWPGELADAFVIGSALTSAQVSALSSSANTASQAAFAAAVQALSPRHFWPLNDDGSTIFTGTVPGLTGAPCSQVAARASVSSSGTTYCLIPATNCATTWGSFGSGTTAIPPATAAASQTLALTVSRVASGFDTVDAPGLHLLIPIRVQESRAAFSTTLTWLTDQLVVQ